MKILMVNTVTLAKNGITNVIFNLIEHMPIDICVDVISINKPDQDYTNRIEARGGRLYTIPRTIRAPLRYVHQLVTLIKKNKYDVVHIHANSHTAVLELLAAKIGGIKVRIVHAHSTDTISRALHILLTPIFNLLCTTRFACGEKSGKFMYDKHKFIVINNGIDVNRFVFSESSRNNIRKGLGLQNNKLLGHIGEFNYIKNQEFLLDMLVELLKNDLTSHLLLIGTGEMQENCMEKARSLGIENNVTFLGTTNEVEKYLSACDLIVMPSLFEGVPLTLIEAQANGLHCIISDTISHEVDKTGNVDYVSIDNGVGDWVKKILSLESDEDRISVSKRAIEGIIDSGYSIHQESAKLVERYKALIG